jgi:hypothetical protein
MKRLYIQNAAAETSSYFARRIHVVALNDITKGEETSSSVSSVGVAVHTLHHISSDNGAWFAIYKLGHHQIHSCPDTRSASTASSRIARPLLLSRPRWNTQYAKKTSKFLSKSTEKPHGSPLINKSPDPLQSSGANIYAITTMHLPKPPAT